MILAIDTSTAACSAALLTMRGEVVAARDEVLGRGHAERLAPMIAELLGGHVPARILVGIGPGSFTGLRVGIACAQGLAIGWSVPLAGMDSLALAVVSAFPDGAPEQVAVAIPGGHGEVFVRSYAGLSPIGPAVSLPPVEAARLITATHVVGGAAAALVAARGEGEAIEFLPSAARAMQLPEALRALDPRPAYARAPDATPSAARPNPATPRVVA